MLLLWDCEACGTSNQIVVSLLKPPPDSVTRICSVCARPQDVRIPDRDPELPARQRKRKIESFRRKSSPELLPFRS